MLETHYLQSNAQREPLRIGLMADSLTLPAWAASIVDHVQKSNFAKIELVILNPADSSKPDDALLYRLYLSWDAKRCGIVNDPERPVDCSSGLKACPIVSFSPTEMSAIRDHNLDIILKFGSNTFEGGISQAARYGIWSYDHDNGGAPYFWEVYERRPLSSRSLLAVTGDQDSAIVLCQANLETQQGVSVARNRVQPYWTSALFVIRKLHELHERGWEYLLQHSRQVGLGRSKKRVPSGGQMMRFLLGWAFGRALPNRLRPERVSYWQVAIRTAENPVSLDQPEACGFHWLNSPRGHYFGDPFLIEKDGKVWLFVEDYSFHEERGVLACAELLDGKISAWRTVLDTGYHLSYPFVFEDDGEMWMIPESASNQTIELYRAEEFPYHWRLEKVLLKGFKATDTTLWREDGTYWFFTTLKDPPEAGPQLFLYYADSLTGEWTYHPSNPICSDARYARCAGKIFLDGDRRVRPSQDHSRGYGCALHFGHIVELSKTSYCEVPLGSMEPAWEKGLTGVHTYNRCGRIEVIDANRPRPRATVL